MGLGTSIGRTGHFRPNLLAKREIAAFEEIGIWRDDPSKVSGSGSLVARASTGHRKHRKSREPQETHRVLYSRREGGESLGFLCQPGFSLMNIKILFLSGPAGARDRRSPVCFWEGGGLRGVQGGGKRGTPLPVFRAEIFFRSAGARFDAIGKGGRVALRSLIGGKTGLGASTTQKSLPVAWPPGKRCRGGGGAPAGANLPRGLCRFSPTPPGGMGESWTTAGANPKRPSGPWQTGVASLRSPVPSQP